MDTKINRENALFMASLDGIYFSDDQILRIEKGIKNVVMNEVAQIDNKGDLIINKKLDLNPKFKDWEWINRTWGIWIENHINYTERSKEIKVLSASDHTLILKAIMENPFQVIKYLPQIYKVNKNAPPGKEVLVAALSVKNIDENVKGKIKSVLDILPKIEEIIAESPETITKALENLKQNLANKNVDEKLFVLKDFDRISKIQDKGFAEGIEIAGQIMMDGRSSIYSPENSFYKILNEWTSLAAPNEKNSAVGDIADADTIGATAGGLAGAVAAGVGAAPGAVAGGASASAGAAISAVIDWLW